MSTGTRSTPGGVVRAADRPAIAIENLGGEGRPVLLMHGAGRSLADLLPLGGLLAQAHRVVAMDFRGHGRSEDGSWSWTEVLDDVRGVLRHLDWHRPALVGHSLGGMVAAMLAGTDECAAAVNLDGHGNGVPEQYDGWDASEVRRRRSELRRRSDEMLSQVLQPLPESQLDALLQAQRQMYLERGVPADAVDEIAGRSYDVRDGLAHPRPAAETVQVVQEQIDSLDLLSVYRTSRVPLLVVNAVSMAADAAAAPDLPWLPEFHAAFRRGLTKDLQELARSTPTVHYAEMRADHGLVLNATAQTAEVVRGFLSTHADW